MRPEDVCRPARRPRNVDLNALTPGQPEKLVGGLGPRLRDCRSLEEASGLLCRELFEHCRTGPDAERSLVLSRVFLSLPFQSLDPETASAVRSPRRGNRADALYMTLLGTHGRAPSWCDRRLSARHRAMPFDRESPPDHAMWRRCFEQVGFETANVLVERPEVWVPQGLFVVPEAAGSDSLPAQEDFIKPLGVMSVIGCGAALPDGAVSVWLGFSRHPIKEHGALPLMALLPSFWHAVYPLYRRRALFS